MVVANGHPFERDAFMAMFGEFPDMEPFFVDHPIAQKVLNPSIVDDVEALVLMDMPGGDPTEGPGYEQAPSQAFKAGFQALLTTGIPIVALHHAIAGWTAWPEYAEFLGGKLLFYPNEVRGSRVLDSGYKQGVTYEMIAEKADHPIFAGVPSRFTIEDEVYLFEVFEDVIDPIARTSYATKAENYYSIARAMAGDRRSNERWAHPPGSSVIAWTKWALRSPLVYLQPGHGPSVYGNRHYRRLLCNAIRWAIAKHGAGNDD
jgi:type 1 glutamine amidotransferase